jgi:hypothetical protein
MSFTLREWKLTVRSSALALTLGGALHVGAAHGADPNSLEKPTNASEIVVTPAPQSRASVTAFVTA